MPVINAFDTITRKGIVKRFGFYFENLEFLH